MFIVVARATTFRFSHLPVYLCKVTQILTSLSDCDGRSRDVNVVGRFSRAMRVAHEEPIEDLGLSNFWKGSYGKGFP